MSEEMSKCNICHSHFDRNDEGGIEGYLGIIPVSFCSSCFTGLVDMVESIAGVSLDSVDDEWRWDE